MSKYFFCNLRKRDEQAAIQKERERIAEEKIKGNSKPSPSGKYVPPGRKAESSYSSNSAFSSMKKGTSTSPTSKSTCKNINIS